MDETLGSSMPPIAEDHLWTSDWGMYPLANNEQGSGVPQAGAGETVQSQTGATQASLDFNTWMGDWQNPQEGSGINVNDSDGVWTFPFS